MAYSEKGYVGLRQFMGYVEEAYHRDLRWPGVQPLYSRLRRSDPEVAMVRGIFAALARGVRLEVELPDEATPADQAAAEFMEQVLEDLDGGQTGLLETMVENVPFFGWGVWEIVPGLRKSDWRPPDDDDWRSQFNDGRVGIRRLGWRDSSSFYRWEFSPNGKVTGMVQYVYPNPQVTLPISDCLHLTFGDAHNPEGLSPLEAIWRLERIKYGLEIVQGMGFEHSAGYLSVKMQENITPDDQAMVRQAARAIMTAQEGNYAMWPSNVDGELKDVNFAAAASILEAIKYYGILKLQIFNSQWMALSATTGTGSLAAMSDSSSMFMITFNAMMDGFAAQIDKQLGNKLQQWNPSVFAGVSKRPRIKATPLSKKISLAELAQIIASLKAAMPLGDEDYKAIRKLTGFLPETLPEVEEAPEPEPAAPEPEVSEDSEDPETAEDDLEELTDQLKDAPTEAALRSRWAAYLLRHPEIMRHV